MRLYIISAVLFMGLIAGKCNEKNASTKMKGRLEVAGMCMNYTISILENKPDTLVVAPEWVDENTNKKYSNAFRLGNPCDFPKTIKAGDEFFFTIDTAKPKQCAVCMAFYPTPSQVLSIKVVE